MGMVGDRTAAGRGERLRVAIVGSGISGLTCAHLLGPDHDVTVFEARGRLGGHTNTVVVDDPDAGPLAIDTGFIVHNDRNYPNLLELFRRLDVSVQDSEMSFSVTDDRTGFTYRATSPATLLARPRNAVDPTLYRMLFDIARFYRAGRRRLATVDAPNRHETDRHQTDRDQTDRHETDRHQTDRDQTDRHQTDPTIGDFLDRGRYGRPFIDLHLLPMGAAIWSTSMSQFRDFPLDTLLRFLNNHGLLSVGDRPRWRTVVGGSGTYVDAIVEAFPGTIRTATPVRSITRTNARGRTPGSAEDGPGKVEVITDGATERFDAVILACHSDQALALLTDPSEDERRILGAIGYRPNLAVLHTDVSVLSPARRAWAAWNYRIGAAVGPEGDSDPTLTYDMTNLQRLPSRRRYLVTLNPGLDPSGGDPPVPGSVLGTFEYAHPQFTAAAVRAQRRIGEIDGVGRTYFCGAYWENGFHEDGVRSALRVCRKLGARWPIEAGPVDSGPVKTGPPGSEGRAT